MRKLVVAFCVLAVVVAAGLGGFWLVARAVRGTSAETAVDAGGDAGSAPASPPLTAGAPPDIRTESVTIYLRARTDEVALAPVPAKIVWFNAPVDRARQVVQLVLEGVPGAEGVVAPVRAGVRYRDVLIATDGTAWVDLDGATIDAVEGSDAEQALVASLARSLVSALPDVRRAGITVDGRPRATLAGHVDLMRTYTGREWPSTDEASNAVPPSPDGSTPADGDGAGTQEGDATRG